MLQSSVATGGTIAVSGLTGSSDLCRDGLPLPSSREYYTIRAVTRSVFRVVGLESVLFRWREFRPKHSCESESNIAYIKRTVHLHFLTLKITGWLELNFGSPVQG